MAVSNIVCEWLRALGLSQYAESFLDNGYDDLEICKQVGDPDLDAIGVLNLAHREKLLKSIRHLREKGAASVYFMLSDPNSLTGSTEILCETPSNELEVVLREQMEADGITLTTHPYSTPDGQRGHLEGLASVYCELLIAPFGDVLSALENTRQASWAERSPVNPAGMLSAGTSTTRHGHYGSSYHGGLPNSHSQPIYVPGKYSPSSCLSDKEEDEIYGFGYGIFASRVAKGALQPSQQHHPASQQQQQKSQLPPELKLPLRQQKQRVFMQKQLNNASTNFILAEQKYISDEICLSPRSAYFYEFPKTESREAKKRTTLARLLKGLRTVNKRDRTNQAIATHIRTTNERLRQFQMNGGGAPQQSFEETIQRLKVQEAMRKKEKFQREHEEILRDIRQGLLQMSRESRADDTYMYDDAIRPYHGIHHHGHWYDEPPYESDPDDFLMAGVGTGPAATIQDGRVCFTSNSKENTGVISLRSAGDISLPQRGPTRRGLIVPQQPPNPPTIIPLTHARSQDREESGDYAGSVSDLQSVTSRLSTISIGTNNCTARYRTLSGGIGESPTVSLSASSDYEDDLVVANHVFSKGLGAGKTKKNGMYKGHPTISQKVTVHNLPERTTTKEYRSSGVDGSSNFNEISTRCFIETKDISREFSLSQDNTDRGSMSDQAFACSASSVESLPSASGSSTQALVRPGSPNSSISTDDHHHQHRSSIHLPAICRAKALVDSLPNPYDKEALRFMKGNTIEVLSMNASGIWKGRCCGRVGHFKFINVEVLSEQRIGTSVNGGGQTLTANKNSKKNLISRLIKSNGPNSVEDLLFRIGLKEYTSVFVLNGYDDLELFKELEPTDLDYLGIINAEHRAKLLTAVQLLHDIECSDGDIAGSSSENDEARLNNINKLQGSPFERRHFPRDSGCYEGSPVPSSQTPTNTMISTDDSNSLDDVVTKCSSEILKRVESARRQKDGDIKCPSTKTTGISRIGRKGLLGGSLTGDETLTRGGGALSEKSSDSGVSSSSLSSNPIKSTS